MRRGIVVALLLAVLGLGAYLVWRFAVAPTERDYSKETEHSEAAAEEEKGPPPAIRRFNYVCSNAEHTKEYEKPGTCEECDEVLQADAPDGVTVEYFCPKHRDEEPQGEPGTCDVEGCNEFLRARQVQPDPKHKADYVCVSRGHAKRYTKPGECEKCGEVLRVRNPLGLPVEYLCPEHGEDVVSERRGQCTEEGCYLLLEARWVQPTPTEKFVYRCPVKEHTEKFDKPGRCPECTMYLEAQTKKTVKYVCPHPEHEYFMPRAGKCGVADCQYFLEAVTVLPPEPEKKPWYRAAIDWVGAKLGRGKSEAKP